MKMNDVKANQQVRVRTDIVLTGIKAGTVGRIIYIQNGRRGSGRSTDLSEYAVQVRFKGGAELWLRSDEIELASSDQ